jgi:mono/diheme cytochrome c family protein
MQRLHIFMAVPAMMLISLISCNNKSSSNKEEDIGVERSHEEGDKAEKGSYLVTAAGCFDCHTPKKMTPMGPEDDSTRSLSGSPANGPLPKITGDPSQPGNWILLAPDFSAFAGPWGMSFPANLTPDSATGLGSWTEETFIRTLRTGKHLGEPNGRNILPPMPWFNLKKLKDEDLSSIFAYLSSLPPVSNKVRAPLSPDELRKLAMDSSGKKM